MITAGVFTNGREAAAAVALDGRLLCALNGHSVTAEGDVPGDVLLQRCLDIARLAPADVGTVARVTDSPTNGPPASGLDGLNGAQTIEVGRLPAQAALLSAVVPENALLVLLDAGCPRGAFAQKIDGRVQALVRWPGSTELVRLGRAASTVLGLPCQNPFVSLATIAGDSTSELDDMFAPVLIKQRDGTTAVDANRLAELLATVQRDCPELERADSLRVAVQRTRSALSSAVLRLITRAITDSIARLREDTPVSAVGVGGSAFASVPLNAGVLNGVSDLAVTPVPEDIGCALGAALAGQRAAPVTHLSLGATFDEYDIKSALENCRLDYVYEPDWPRLFDRVSGILSSGKTVAWFQGATEFGPRALGHRSILCDPSSRYARENVNVYLLGRELSLPLPVSLASSAVTTCLDEPRQSPFMLLNGRVASRARDQLQAVVNSDGKCVIHTPTPDGELDKLLEVHVRRRGVPGLINVPLAGTATGLASDPKDAIRTAFGSAVDALVIGRFLVSKDYWLLRGQTTA